MSAPQVDPTKLPLLLFLLEGTVDASVVAGRVPLRTEVVQSALTRHPGETPTYWVMDSILSYGQRIGLFLITSDRSLPPVQSVKVNANNPIVTSEDLSLLKAASSAYCVCVANEREGDPPCRIEDSWAFVNQRFKVATCLESYNGTVTGFRVPNGPCPCSQSRIPGDLTYTQG